MDTNPTAYKVMELIRKYPNCKWYRMWDTDGLSYSQYRYWAEKFVTLGMVRKIEHGHNQYNGWTGYKVTSDYQVKVETENDET